MVRAIELFSGIGGFRLALGRVGAKVVFANDIDENVCEVYRSNFPDGSLRQGDIRSIRSDDIPHHELLTAGFPCQPFSPAGKKLGVKCPINGTLFEQIIRIMVDKRPKYFLLENVRRMLSMEDGYHFATVLDELSRLGYIVEWRVINAISFGIPQHRQRVFIAGWRDHGKATISPRLNTSRSLFSEIRREQMRPILNAKVKFRFWGMAVNGLFVHEDAPDDMKLQPLPKLKELMQRDEEIDPVYDYTGKMDERLSSSSKVDRFHNGVEILYNQRGGARFGYTVFGTEGCASTLTASTSRHYERYLVGNKFRRLTNIEYARLMGFPDDWCRVLSKYDQHSAFGNAVVPNCVEWALNRLSMSDNEDMAA